MTHLTRLAVAAAIVSGCSDAADRRVAVCPLPASSLEAPPVEGAAVVWNYLGSVPLPPGWSVREATGTRLDLVDAEFGSRLRLELSCCGPVPPLDGGGTETATAAGRLFHIAAGREGTAERQVFRTFPFAVVGLEEDGGARGRPIRPPALLTATLVCTGSGCAEGRAMVLGIGYDERATRLAVEGVAGPCTAAAPLRSDGVPSDIELPPPVPGVAPRTFPDPHTPEACA